MTTARRAQDVLADYLAVWTDPSPQRDLSRLDELTTDDVRFKDPVQEVIGRSRLKAIFADAARSVAHPLVTIDAIAWVDDRRAFVKWHYGGTLIRLKLQNWQVAGMSDMRFASDGRLEKHEDHWDLSSGLFEHFPLVGGLFRRLRHRLRIHRG
ncbi:MAG: nuclear transport factor 2 family protein [Rhodospirillaceae bacterium]|nr:nuclear transport factor 2 family protein [Rhodospirillaceae bacterium]